MAYAIIVLISLVLAVLIVYMVHKYAYQKRVIELLCSGTFGVNSTDWKETKRLIDEYRSKGYTCNKSAIAINIKRQRDRK